MCHPHLIFPASEFHPYLNPQTDITAITLVSAEHSLAHMCLSIPPLCSLHFFCQYSWLFLLIIPQSTSARNTVIVSVSAQSKIAQFKD